MNKELTLQNKVEAVLFFKAEQMSISKLSSILGVSVEVVEVALKELETNLQNRGIVLVRNDDDIVLQTAPEASSIIETITKDELSKDIGKAGLEVLSIVLYRGPVTKRDIDYIRGVNSSLVLRNLMIRDLVERADSRGARNSFIYKPTFALLSHLGVKNVNELPEYEDVQKEIEDFKNKESNGEHQ